MTQHKIAMLTAGGLAPCLSSAVGGLIERYSELAPDAPMIGYLAATRGCLQGNAITVTPEVRRRAHVLHEHGGTPSATAGVKLTNVADCVKRGLVKDGEEPLKVAASQLVKDGITISTPSAATTPTPRPQTLPPISPPTAMVSPSSACPRPSTMT